MRILPLVAAIGISFGLSSGVFLAPAWADTVRLHENAPDKHIVVKGDTLWDISATFLKDPWKWPEVWGFNREQIKNPHLIYPGDVVYLHYVDGKPRLSLEKGRFGETVKLSPQVRSEPIVLKDQGVSSIPLSAILPFISKGVVGSAEELINAPRVLGSATGDSRVMFAKGDLVFATTSEIPGQNWRVMRMGQALKNPDNEKEVLAYELVYVGEAVSVAAGDPQTLRITSNDQEILERDRLLPAWDGNPPQFMPHEPEKPVNAKVVAALGGPTMAGTWMNLVLNQGKKDGIAEGHVLALFKPGRSIADPKCLRAEKIAFMSGRGREHAEDCKPNKDDKSALPETRIGEAFVYRVFDQLSYALVVRSTEPVSTGDAARNP